MINSIIIFCVNYGGDFNINDDFFHRKNRKPLLDKISDYTKKEGLMNFTPRFYSDDEIEENKIQVLIWNRIIYEKVYDNIDDFNIDEFYDQLMELIIENKDEWTVEGEQRNLELFLDENGINRDSCNKLFDYYRNVRDKRASFHWLKKAYGKSLLMRDKRSLARCYKYGEGCSKNMKLFNKLTQKNNSERDKDKNF